MPNILVAYVSLTGNTKTIAEAIHSGLGSGSTLSPLKEVENPGMFDLIFVGFPVHSHSVPGSAERFLKSIPAGKKIALFSTHGSLSGSRLSREALEYASVLASHCQVLGSFSCRGKISIHAMESFNKSPEHQAWAEMAVTASSHPDDSDIADAKTFAQWILTLYRQS